MWRALFLAIGISLCFLGGECLVVDRAVLAGPGTVAGSDTYDPFAYESAAPKRIIVPPEWAPWSLLSAGVVVIMYAMTIRGGSD